MQVACPHAADNEKSFIQHEIKTRSHIEHGQKQQQQLWLCQVALGHVEAELNIFSATVVVIVVAFLRATFTLL